MQIFFFVIIQDNLLMQIFAKIFSVSLISTTVELPFDSYFTFSVKMMSTTAFF